MGKEVVLCDKTAHRGWAATCEELIQMPTKRGVSIQARNALPPVLVDFLWSLMLEDSHRGTLGKRQGINSPLYGTE